MGLAWSNTKPNSLRSEWRSTSLAPISPGSSMVVNTSSSPTGGPPRSIRWRTAPMIVATAALLSAPRMPSLRLRRTPPSRSTSTGAASGTVSRWAQSRMVRAPSGPGTRAIRLPLSDPVAAALSSSCTSRPRSARSAATASAIGRSRVDGLSISQ